MIIYKPAALDVIARYELANVRACTVRTYHPDSISIRSLIYLFYLFNTLRESCALSNAALCNKIVWYGWTVYVGDGEIELDYK